MPSFVKILLACGICLGVMTGLYWLIGTMFA